MNKLNLSRSFAAGGVAMAALVTASCGRSEPRPPPPTAYIVPRAEEPPVPPTAPSPVGASLGAPAHAGEESGHAGHEDHPATTEYVCPMHSDVRLPAPGRCPRCGMTLVPQTSAAGSDTGSAAQHPADGHPH